MVFVALGVPKQEQWIAEKLSHLDGVVAIGIGGSFDVLAGNIPRAPEWMQQNRLEWLYRLYFRTSTDWPTCWLFQSLCGPLLEINRGVLNRAYRTNN